MSESLERFEVRPFVFRSREGASFGWETYGHEEAEFPDRDPYGKEIPTGTRVLRTFGGKETWTFQPFTMAMEVAEGRGSPKVPLWETFGNLALTETDFLRFATQHGRLGPTDDMSHFRLRSIRVDPKPHKGSGHIIRVRSVLDTLPFWKQEAAFFRLFLTIDRAIEKNDDSLLKDIVHPGPHGQGHFLLDFSYQGESVTAFASKGISPHIWQAAGGGGVFDPIKAARAFSLDLIQNRLRQFPVELSLAIGCEYAEVHDPGKPKYLPEVPYPILTPSCLLAAMYWSYAQKLMGLLKYRRCSVCKLMGYIGGKGRQKQMVRRENGDWVHVGTEYESLKKSESRKRKRELRIISGEPIRGRGRPRKSPRQG